jgi:hypothetical protein
MIDVFESTSAAQVTVILKMMVTFLIAAVRDSSWYPPFDISWLISYVTALW